jgi:hypothetical protein
MLNIKCSKCKLFFESIKKPNGECYKRCDICREKHKEYYKLNAEKIKEWKKEHYKLNAEKIKEHRKEYYKKNAEKAKEYYKEYNKLNTEKIKEYYKEYNKLNAEKLKENTKEYQKEYRNNIKKNNFKLYLIYLQRKQINRSFKSSLLNKNKHSIEYLGCDIETLINHFQKKIDYFNNNIAIDEIMTFHNIHIDHIKPISKFNLDDENEFLKCSHYTNMQPLLIKDNLEKSNKRNDDNEIYWNEKIINNDDYNEIYLNGFCKY